MKVNGANGVNGAIVSVESKLEIELANIMRKFLQRDVKENHTKPGRVISLTKPNVLRNEKLQKNMNKDQLRIFIL